MNIIRILMWCIVYSMYIYIYIWYIVYAIWKDHINIMILLAMLYGRPRVLQIK